MSIRSGQSRTAAGMSDAWQQRKDDRNRLLTRVFFVVAALLGFWGTWVLVGPDPDVLDSFPTEIIGTWESSDPRYRDRSILILEDEIELGLGADGDPLAYRVREVRRTDAEDYVAYELTYYTPEGEVQLELRLSPDGTARLRNPPDVVWSRVP